MQGREPRRLTSPDNPEAKMLMDLHTRRGRKAAGKLLLEGPASFAGGAESRFSP